MIFNKKIVSIILVALLLYLIITLNPITANKSFAVVSPGTLTPDIDGIDDNAYPGFKNLINSLRSSHPNYTFLVYYTGLDWNEVLNAEYQGHGYTPRNLFQVKNKYDGMWKCPICGNSTFDNGSWSCASKEALAYMMDPRNSINESDLFQFKDLEGSDVSRENIKTICSKYGAYLNNDEAVNAIYDSSIQYRVNPYFLIAKIVNEQGTNGSTLSAGNGYGGNYVGLYNYFNIGAYGNGVANIINNGFKYAQSKGWTSIRASIFGGAEEIRKSYMDTYSQNTYYYQKFNVSGRSSLASHQYQQNVMAAQTQGTSYKSYYTQTNISGNYTFIIPLYYSMPTTVSARPDYTKANSISYINGSVNSSTNVTVKASPNGTSIGVLNNGEQLKILLRSTSKIGNSYWDLVVSKKDGTYGYVARDINGTQVINAESEPTPQPTPTPSVTPDNQLRANGVFLEMVPSVTAENVITKYGAGVVIKDKTGKEVKTGNLATGYTALINGTTYKITKKGDVDGDGLTSILDAVAMLNTIKGTKTLTDEYYRAGIVESSSNTSFSVIDVVKLLNYIKNNDSSLNF